MTPSFKTDDECDGCLEVLPLLLPVALETIGGRIVDYLCLACRLNWHDGPYSTLAAMFEHSVVKQWRAGVGGAVPPRFLDTLAEEQK